MLESSNKEMEGMFRDSRNYVTEVQQKIREANAENERLKLENMKLQFRA